MSRINTNVQSLLAQRVLGQNNKALNQSLERLSTGLKINRGADDPAGLIASENLRSETAAIDAAIGNAERADQVVNIAEGGLQEISTMLLELQGLVGQSANDAGLSDEERAANQLQIDSILQTIDRIAAATSFQGTKLLNGTFDFTVSGQDSEVLDFNVNGAKLAHGEHRDVSVLITNSAQHGALKLSLGGGSLNFGGNADNRFTFEVAGSLGSREFTFASSTDLTDMVTQINTFSSVTGVSAMVSGGTSLSFRSTEYGSDSFVALSVVDDGGQAGAIHTYDTLDENTALVAGSTTLANAEGSNPVRDDGQDVGAIINGISATSRGLVARVNTDFLDVELELSDNAAAGTANGVNLGNIGGAGGTALTITGGGAKFNLGPNVDILNQVSLGIGNVASRNLGTLTNGFLDELGSSRTANVEDGDVGQAQSIVNDAIQQIASLRGRLGAFQRNIVGSTIRSLGVALENTSAAESSIRDTDFAEQTAELTRSQILVSAATNTLGMANSQPQSALQLLG